MNPEFEKVIAVAEKLHSEFEEVHNLKVSLAGFGEKIILSIARDPESIYVFAPWGSGDVLAIAAYASHIRKAHPEKKQLFLVCRKNCSDIANMFEAINGSISINVDECECVTLASTMRGITFGSNYIVGDLQSFYTEEFPTRLDPFKRFLLQIPLDTKPDPVSESFLGTYDQALEKKWCNTVILAPYAVAYPLLSENIWAIIANRLKKKGYQVYTNVYGEEAAISGTDALRVSIQEVYQLSRYISGLISYRSGFSDIMGTNPLLPHIVIHATENSLLKEKITDLYPSEYVKSLLLSDKLFQEIDEAVDRLFH